MMRVFSLWPAAGVAMVLLACNRDKSRDAAMQQDSTASAPAPVSTPPTDTAAPPAVTTDTGKPVAPAETTPAAKPRPKPSAAAPAAKPTQRAAATQDSTNPNPKPIVEPRRTGQPPKVPAGAVAQTTQDTSQPAPLRDPYHQAPRDTVSQVVYNGWKQFNLNCARCHGEDVLGTTIAPHLTESLKPDGPINTKALFIQTVCNGRPEKGMPAWCSIGLDTGKIEQIYSYVKGRSDGTIHPGRPAVR